MAIFSLEERQDLHKVLSEVNNIINKMIAWKNAYDNLAANEWVYTDYITNDKVTMDDAAKGKFYAKWDSLLSEMESKLQELKK